MDFAEHDYDTDPRVLAAARHLHVPFQSIFPADRALDEVHSMAFIAVRAMDALEQQPEIADFGRLPTPGTRPDYTDDARVFVAARHLFGPFKSLFPSVGHAAAATHTMALIAVRAVDDMAS